MFWDGEKGAKGQKIILAILRITSQRATEPFSADIGDVIKGRPSFCKKKGIFFENEGLRFGKTPCGGDFAPPRLLTLFNFLS